MGTTPVAVDRERCVGSGMCVMYAPDSFAHDETAKAVVLDPTGDPDDVISSAVDACPTGALRLVEGVPVDGAPSGGALADAAPTKQKGT